MSVWYNAPPDIGECFGIPPISGVYCNCCLGKGPGPNVFVGETEQMSLTRLAAAQAGFSLFARIEMYELAGG